MRNIRGFSHNVFDDDADDFSMLRRTLENEGVEEADVISMTTETHRPPMKIVEGDEPKLCLATIYVLYWTDS